MSPTNLSECDNNSTEASIDEICDQPSDFSFKQLLKSIGPGIVTGASDDDPSGIATYSLAGASYGFSFLWTAPLFLPLVACIEYTCAKIAMVTGCGLAGVLRTHYSRPLLYLAVGLLFVANTINAGTDIGAIASAMNLFLPSIPSTFFVPVIAISIISFQIMGSYKIISAIFKLFTMSLLSYFLCVFFIDFDWFDVLKHTFVPEMNFDMASIMMFVALLGTRVFARCCVLSN